MRGARLSVPTLLIFTSIVMFIFLILQPIQVYQFKEYIAVLFPKGWIALEERNLLFIIQAIMLLVILPVYILTFVFSWKYRADNKNAKYDPDIDDNVVAEVIWWGLPLVLTAIVAVITYQKTHELDPYRPIASDKKPVTIQVVALQYKWLFIYPEHQIASLNFLQIPEKTPIRFEITSDAPMNSFWIPHLGGQIYAMPGMQTLLHLIADTTGDFRGSSANISGVGFASMHFITRASTEEEYAKWIEEAKKSTSILDATTYNVLAKPSENNLPQQFQVKESKLFHDIIMKYMQPTKG